MRKNILFVPASFIIVLMSLALTVHSQNNNIDSILAVLENLSDDTAKIRILNHLSKELAGNNPDQALKLAEEALELSEKTNCLPCKAASLRRIGGVFFFQGRYNDALELFQKALTIVERTGDHVERAGLLKAIGTSYIAMGNSEEAALYYRKSLSVAKYIGDTSGMSRALVGIGSVYDIQGELKTALSYYVAALRYTRPGVEETHRAGIINNIGLINYYLGNHAQSLTYFLQSLEIAERIGDKRGSILALGNLGMVHESQGKNDKAMEYYMLALPVAEKIGDKYSMANMLGNIAKVHYNRNDYAKAIEFYSRNLSIRRETGDQKGIADALNNLGISYKAEGEYRKAEEYYKQALAIYEAIGDQVGLSTVLTNIGVSSAYAGDLGKALSYLKRSLDISISIGKKEMIMYNYENFRDIYERQNDFKNAFLFAQKCSEMKDSLLNDETSRQITEMQTKYDSEKKEKEITILKKDKEIQNSEVRRQKLMRNSFIGAAALALLLALLLYNRYLIKRRANIRLADQNEKIRMQKDLIEEQKQNITDSIEYACNIQKAMLPTEDEFTRLFPEAFILYRPRDIVSGDFYWVASPPSFPPMGGSGVSPPPTGEVGRGAVLFATADCTGHGVPGAFMSMLCTALLNEAVNDKGLTKPNEIFEEVRKGIIGALKQRGQTGGSKDGMDATIISLVNRNVKTPNLGISTLNAACANNPVYIVSRGSLTEIPPDRFPVGVHENEQKPFTCHEMEVIKGDMIYSVTDGFEDQLGGEKGKKFKSVKLRELLLAIAPKPVSVQKDILEKAFEDWKGTGEQTDDVTIIGIRI